MGDDKALVVVGGTGHFGARICRRIVGEPGTRLVVTGRDESALQCLVDELRESRPGSMVDREVLDQHADGFERELRLLGPDVVIHTAGPYQGQDYRVARACIECGSHYIDLADGREFVEGFASLHEQAAEKGILLVSGASSLPGLSSAVVEALRDRFGTLESIEISIAPGHRTPRGRATIGAVLSYCGKPFQVLANGHWVTRHGWQDLRIQRYPHLGRRLSGGCDVPDLSLLPRHYPDLNTVSFHAALEAPWEQLALWSMGWLTRLGLVRDWQGLVPVFHRLSDRLIGLGSDTGGMQIRITGIDTAGRPRSYDWHLTARRNHGPEIPCTPALILARRLLRGDLSLRGAHPCLGLISLADFDKELRGFDITWEIIDSV
ncbi:MAG: saccharopine dehydrogenase NADP-binding domain-containing protein [Chromatiales bacterium]|jgi:hypothetical protein